MKKEKKIIEKGDMNETKSLIINCAGILIAKYGYAKVTSKSICEKAKVNMAAINYHFGSRDGLYIAVLKEIHNFLVNIDDLNKLYSSDLTAKEKVELFIDIFVESFSDEKNWYIKVWAREILNPTPFIDQILTQEVLPKLNIVSKIFSEYTGLSLEDLELYSCILNTISPFIIAFLAHNAIEFLPIEDYSRQNLVSHLKRFILAGLDEFKENGI